MLLNDSIKNLSFFFRYKRQGCCWKMRRVNLCTEQTDCLLKLSLGCVRRVSLLVTWKEKVLGTCADSWVVTPGAMLAIMLWILHLFVFLTGYAMYSRGKMCVLQRAPHPPSWAGFIWPIDLVLGCSTTWYDASASLTSVTECNNFSQEDISVVYFLYNRQLFIHFYLWDISACLNFVCAVHRSLWIFCFCNHWCPKAIKAFSHIYPGGITDMSELAATMLTHRFCQNMITVLTWHRDGCTLHTVERICISRYPCSYIDFIKITCRTNLLCSGSIICAIWAV